MPTSPAPTLVRWGILGTGRIAADFARGLADEPTSALVAVGSRSRESADRFASMHAVARAHATYEALAADPDVDVVYVATPHAMHRQNTLLCLEAGKAVLCEKPLAINAREARVMVEAARRRGLLLVEGIWTRYLPAIERLVELCRDGAIGEPRLVTADFGFRGDGDPSDIVFDRKLGGGALLDVGVYPVWLASLLLGPAVEAVGLASMTPGGIDEQFAITLRHAGGALSSLSCAIRTETQQQAIVAGTEGRIHLHRPWWAPTRITLHREGEADRVEELPYSGNGYAHEARAVADAFRASATEVERVPLDESIAVLETLDRLRAAEGPTYPADAPTTSST